MLLNKAPGFTLWLSNKRTQETMEHLSLNTGIPVFNLVTVEQGRGGGTWLHPKLATRFAIWLSDEFGLWVEDVIEAVMEGRSPIATHQDVQGKDQAIAPAVLTPVSTTAAGWVS